MRIDVVESTAHTIFAEDRHGAMVEVGRVLRLAERDYMSISSLLDKDMCVERHDDPQSATLRLLNLAKRKLHDEVPIPV